MNSQFKRVLILAPHTDDGELGAGGTIAQLIEQGASIHYVAFSTAEESVPDGMPKDILKTEVKAATSKLGIRSDHLHIFNFQVRKLNYHRQEILEKLIKLRSSINPDLVLMPSLKDIHQDHLTIAEEGLRAFKKTTVLGYELIWNNLNFNSCAFIKLEKSDLEKKCEALYEYSSQRGRDYMSRDFIYSLAKIRGVQIGADYAECFEVIRWIV